MPATKFRTQVKANNGLTVDEIFVANGDLSSCQFRFVAFGTVAGEVIGATGASNPFPIGILQNAPGASKPAIVRLFGKSNLVVPANASTLNPGDFVTSTGCGGGMMAAACGGIVLARWLSSQVASAVAGSGVVFLNSAIPSASMGSAS